MTVILLESLQNLYDELGEKGFVENTGVSYLTTNIKGPYGEKYVHYSYRSAQGTLFTTFNLNFKSNHIGAGCWFYATNDGGTNQPFFSLNSIYDGNYPSTYQVGAEWYNDLFVMRYRTGLTNYTAVCYRGGMEINRWYYVEFEFYRNASGWLKAWIDGQYVGSFFGDTEYYWWETPTHVMLKSNDEYNTAYHGPFWVLDLSAQPHNTMPLGMKRVRSIVASGAGNYTQWDVSGESNNYDAVNDEPVNDNRVETSVSGEYDTYVMEDISPSDEVLAVQCNISARKSGVGESAIKTVFRSAGGEDFEMSGEHWLNQSYQYFRTIYDNNPSGEISWTATDFISGEWGIKLQR